MIRRMVPVLLLLAIVGCNKESKVGDWYEYLGTRERIQIRLIGTLEEMRGFTDEFYTTKFHLDTLKAGKSLREEKIGSQLWVLRYMLVEQLNKAYPTQLKVNAGTYEGFKPYSKERFFLFMSKDEPLYMPASLFARSFVRVPTD